MAAPQPGTSANPPASPLERRSTYDSEPDGDRTVLRLLRNGIRQQFALWAEQPGPKRILDIGCGQQPFRPELESAGFDYFGFDATEMGSPLVATGLIDGPLPEALIQLGQVDYLLCTEVLEHVFDWPKAFENFKRLLRPGGELLISCPFVYPLHETPHDYWRPTYYALRTMAEREGWKVVSEQRLGNPAQTLGVVAGQLLRLFPYDAPTSFLQRIRSSLAQRATRLLLRVIVGMTEWELLQRRFDSDRALYLSNLVLLKRP